MIYVHSLKWVAMLSGSFNALSLLACDPSYHEKVFDIFLYIHTYIHTVHTYMHTYILKSMLKLPESLSSSYPPGSCRRSYLHCRIASDGRSEYFIHTYIHTYIVQLMYTIFIPYTTSVYWKCNFFVLYLDDTLHTYIHTCMHTGRLLTSLYVLIGLNSRDWSQRGKHISHRCEGIDDSRKFLWIGLSEFSRACMYVCMDGCMHAYERLDTRNYSRR